MSRQENKNGNFKQKEDEAGSATHLGTRVSVRTEGGERTATVVRTPFYDPLRLRTQPEGRGR